MDIEINDFCELIGNLLNKEWLSSDTKPNKLTLSCIYALNIFGEADLIYWKTALCLVNLLKSSEHLNINKTENSPTEESIRKLLISIYCILASNTTIYSLPSMLDQTWKDGKIVPHIIFGESLANLLSITLIAESHKFLLTIDTPYNKNKLINVLNKQLREFRMNSQVITNFNNIKKEMLHKDFKKFKVNLLINTINAVLFLFGYRIEELSKLDTIKENLANTLLSNKIIDNRVISDNIIKSGLITKTTD